MICETVRGSHLDTFQMCPLRYRWLCHERKHPDILIHRWAILGWVIHATLKEALDNGKDVFPVWKRNLKLQADIARDEFSKVWYDISLPNRAIPFVGGKDYARALTMLSNWQKFRHIFEEADTIQTETQFHFPIDDFVYTGTIDVKARKKNSFAIVDYKSSKMNWEKKSIPDQLYRYSMQSHVDDKPDKITMVLFNLESGNILTDTYDFKQTQKVMDSIRNQVSTIRKTEPQKAKAKVGSHCATLCEYSHSCVFYQRTLKGI